MASTHVKCFLCYCIVDKWCITMYCIIFAFVVWWCNKLIDWVCYTTKQHVMLLSILVSLYSGQVWTSCTVWLDSLCDTISGLAWLWVEVCLAVVVGWIDGLTQPSGC